ncbi:MAG: tyrosine-protein phosphatase [Pseudomonadales bacterium]|jgi:protein-tyrosine phosphatase|nr:tyrosine-protein phosphatase [Pseudomonadales bacterium]
MSDRHFPLPGTINLRDFGGYDTRLGRPVRRRRLFRSGHMAELAQHGHDDFVALGIETICDLRRPEERDAEPTPVPEDLARRVEIEIDPGSAIAMRAALADADLHLEDRIRYMVDINRDLARDHADHYARMFEALLETEGGFLIHCAAGKDRTGFGCALILHTLGVDEQTILEDYLATNDYVDIEGQVLPRLRRWYGDRSLPDHETIMALAGVRPEYLRAALEVIEDEFEGMDAYLERTVGLDASAREALRARLLET